ncbi:MAG: HAMP domain-containing histidine kinase, partial [Clostridia bacterium]|nr:HAMP domain-containing histidine kinase [Clostridia bacterium]
SAEIFDRIIMQNDINVRIIDTSDFEKVYSGGDGFISATHDIGNFEVMRLYNLAVENGGEISQYYTYDKEKEHHMLSEKKHDEEKRPQSGEHIPDNSGVKENADGDDDEDRRQIGVQFYTGRHPAPFMFFRNYRYVDDFLYARLVSLNDGTELMIISDVQVTPLDSTVAILKSQLIVTTVIALILSLLLSYFVARYIAKPIENLNASAKKLARGDLNTEFSGKGYREIEQLSDTLNYAAKEISRVDSFRRELLANVSHDLRTPLTMIEGYAEVMRDIPGENTPENVQVIIDEANRLTEFVNNILDLSKLQSGIQSLNPEKTNLSVMLSDISIRYINLMKSDGYTIELSAPDDVYISCDENKLLQALNNLMDNAVNHTGEDKKVFIRQIVDGNTVRVEISDTGKGISADELPYIWERYYRAEGNHKRAVVGSGIGLSIVKSIFELHNAKYGVESTVGKGSTFWVEFNILKENISDSGIDK